MVWCLRWTVLPPQNDLKVKVKRSPSCALVSPLSLRKKVTQNLLNICLQTYIASK